MRKLDGNIAEAFKLARGNILTFWVCAYEAESQVPIDPILAAATIRLAESGSRLSLKCRGSSLNQSKTPDHKYLFVYSFYTQLKVIKGTTVLGDNMVLQDGEKHCNSCGATTQNQDGVTFCTVAR